MRVFQSLVLAATLCSAADAYLFTSFRGNGETGIYFALSTDGYRWEALNGNDPWIKPAHAGMLMRDPCIQASPDGLYHMVWTTSWDKMGGRLVIGHASSRDLVNWGEQQLIRVMAHEPDAVNAWAPELLWDAKNREWLIFWASSIPGRFPDPSNESRPDRNHRIYATATRDFKTFSAARPFFDPGFSVIDSTIIENGGRYLMVVKDERENPPRKNLRLAFSSTASGPYTGITGPFTRDWIEGPSILRIGNDTIVYYDSYRKPQHYGAVRSSDLKSWQDITAELTFPSGHRHGTVLRIDAARAGALRTVRR
jgi:hypothetical protein